MALDFQLRARVRNFSSGSTSVVAVVVVGLVRAGLQTDWLACWLTGVLCWWLKGSGEGCLAKTTEQKRLVPLQTSSPTSQKGR